MVLLIERGGLDPEEVRRALAATFGRRGGRAVPGELMPPPETWSAEFAAMATQAGLSHAELATAFQTLQQFWRACT